MTQQTLPVDPQRSQRIMRDDEIDLAELFRKIWDRKWWVVASTVLAILVAAAYLLTAKPVYKAEFYLMPPTVANISALNIKLSRSGTTQESPGGVLLENTVTPQQAYERYLNQLRSRQQQYLFFFEEKLASVYGDENAEPAAVFPAFQESLSVQVPRGETVFTSLTLEGPAPEMVAELVNEYADIVAARAAAQLVAELNSKRDRKLETLEKEIGAKRALAEERRRDRILALEEALVVAEAVGLKSSMESSGSDGGAQNINILNSDVLYMRGTDALRAEIAVLKARGSDDAFIEGLRTLEEDLKQLKAIDVGQTEVWPMQVDLEALPPQAPIQPKKKLIMAAALVLGGMLGLFIALAVPARRRAD